MQVLGTVVGGGEQPYGQGVELVTVRQGPDPVVAVHFLIEGFEVGDQAPVGRVNGVFDLNSGLASDTLLLFCRQSGLLHLCAERNHQDALFDRGGDEVAHLVQDLGHHELRRQDAQ